MVTQKKIYKSYLFSYRLFAFFMLYGLLLVIGSYGFTMGFYSINHGWVVPMSISPSNDKILAMTQQAVTTQSTLNTLLTTNSNLLKTRVELLNRKAALQALDSQLTGAVASERSGNTLTGVTLDSLSTQKTMDIAATKSMLDQFEQQKAGIDHDLKMGLITQVEYNQQLTTLIQFKNSFTDSQVSKAMTDLTRQKLASASYNTVDMVSKQVELRSKIADYDLQISMGDDQIKNNDVQIATIRKAFDTVRENPYYLATKANSPLTFAFVPYDNQNRIAEGSVVYDCLLSMIGCKEVGKISRVFHDDEEKAINPFYKTDLRGFLVQLDLSNSESKKSKTLFVGNKPLLF
jgi:hypothetical protein